MSFVHPQILPFDHNVTCMEDIVTSTGAIDAMAEEIIKPTQPFGNSKTSFLAAKPSAISQERSRVMQEGHEHHVTSYKSSGPATIEASVGGDSGSRKSGGGLTTDKHLPEDQPSKSQQARKDNRTGKGVGDSALRTRLGPPPKLPPKPPGLLERIKEGNNGGPGKAKQKVLGQQVQKGPGKPRTVSPKLHKKKVQNAVSHPGSFSSTDPGDSREVHTGDSKGSSSSRNVGNASPVSPIRSPLTVTRSAQPAMQSPSTRDSHDGIQRTISSPTGIHADGEKQKMAFDTQHSTDKSDKEPMVRSRVHDIQENLLHGSHEHAPMRHKKLSVTDHHIRVRERAAVFEKIVQGISEKTSVVSLDVDAAGPRKRCARKAEGQTSPGVGIKPGGDSDERITPESSSMTSSTPIQPLLRTHNRHPVPRPRSNIPVITEAEEPKPPSALPAHPIPKPRVRNNQTRKYQQHPHSGANSFRFECGKFHRSLR